jgi:single-strand DNA-binding protein
MDINTITIIGRLTAKPEIKQAGQHQVSNFTVAVNSGFGEKKEVAFIDCTAWNKTAENLVRYCDKGKQVGISGEIRQQHWQAQDGSKRSKLYINVNNLQFLGSKQDDGNQPQGW